MRGQLRARSERGASAVEYAIIVGAISLALLLVAAALGVNVQTALCSAGRALGGNQTCTTAGPNAGSPTSATASASPSAHAGGGGSSSTSPGGPTSPASTGVSGTSGGSGGSGGSTGGTDDPGTTSGQSNTSGGASTASASPSASVAPNSAGKQQFYLATIDQDQINSDLSVRVNAGWQPTDWSSVTYPTTTVVDITWSPALAVDQVIPGSDGTWSSVLVSPGHMRLTRTGPFDATGFQPEPEILLKKPTTTTLVTANFSITTANTPALSATSSIRSTPY